MIQPQTWEKIAAAVRTGLSLAAVCWALLVPSAAQVTAIRSGKLIDPDSGTVLAGQTILIRAGKIEAVGTEVVIPADAKIIDLSTMTVLPGLIDCHTHVASGAQDALDMDMFRQTAAQYVLASVPNARVILESGFTTVRDVGTMRALVDVALRDAINRGDIVGPHMFVAGAYVTITGGAGSATALLPTSSCHGICAMARQTARGKCGK